MSDKNSVKERFLILQDEICKGLEQLDGKEHFREDVWEREGGGGGRTRIMTDGDLIEKGGVNFSAVHGPMPERICKALEIELTDFFATGISIVLHPGNPFVPIIHMNIRYFETTSGLWWFGGGIDLTPHYIDTAVASRFHSQLKDVCDRYDPQWYPEFKSWADDYFFVKHRNETRGVGGIFFDRLDSKRAGKEILFDFVSEVAKAFVPVYRAAVEGQRHRKFNPRNKEWQLIRRSRYAEFNLVWDKGTRFGLDTGGNIESILMSLPPICQWQYKHLPDEEEQKTLDLLKKDIDWINYSEAQ